MQIALSLSSFLFGVGGNKCVCMHGSWCGCLCWVFESESVSFSICFLFFYIFCHHDILIFQHSLLLLNALKWIRYFCICLPLFCFLFSFFRTSTIFSGFYLFILVIFSLHVRQWKNECVLRWYLNLKFVSPFLCGRGHLALCYICAMNLQCIFIQEFLGYCNCRFIGHGLTLTTWNA